MNEITINGNLTDEPTFRLSQATSRPVLSLRVAVNDRRYDQAKGKWVDAKAVFHNVVAFNLLAQNAAETLHRGMAVIVTGKFVDNSWTDDAGNTHYRIDLLASDIAPSLRWATATLTRRTSEQAQAEAGQPTEAAQTADTGQTAEAA